MKPEQGNSRSLEKNRTCRIKFRLYASGILSWTDEFQNCRRSAAKALKQRPSCPRLDRNTRNWKRGTRRSKQKYTVQPCELRLCRRKFRERRAGSKTYRL